LGSTAFAQSDGSVTDSVRKITFPETDGRDTSARIERSLDLVVGGGAGSYAQGTLTAFQAMANLDFYAQTRLLDLTAGFHWGFSNPSTQGLSVGLRFPITGNRLTDHGVYADASVLFFDNGHDTNAFQTGLRGSLVGRSSGLHVEARLTGEVRRFPIGLNKFDGWIGLELGYFTTLLREQIREPSRKDSLKAALKYIATTQELQGLSATQNDAELALWLANFWKSRDLTLETPQVEAEHEYERRTQLANRLYGSPRQMGVETDQGRVTLIYGEPDNIEGATSILDPGIRYTLWTYTKRVKGYRTALFLFVTRIGTSSAIFAQHGDQRQIYSNIPGEYTEGIPTDLPIITRNYIEQFR
jgi:GWxTD domain-containing protein